MDEMEEQNSEKELLKTSLSENNEDAESFEENKTCKSPTQIIPALRLNIALASDPATNPDAKEFLKIHIKSELKSGDDDDDDDEYMNPNKDLDTISETVNLPIQSQRSDGSQKSKENINNINQMLVKNLEILPRQNVYMCVPCSIRFSSLSTLEAHQNFYCAHRKDADENPNKTSNISGETNGSEPPTKAIKTGKQYACTQCSYSADKKVSLNRHMRMHQTSPAPSSIATSNGDDTTSSQIIVPASIIGPSQPIIDRYCSNCDIRFSSMKTYRAHKDFYCNSRHQG
jgi:zinc finger protein ZFPM1